MLNRILNIGHAPLSLFHHDLGQVGDLVLNCILDLVELVPEVLLDLGHITPSIHSVCLNITYFLVILVLLLLLALDLVGIIGLLGCLDNQLGNFLRSPHLLDFHVLFESLSNDLANRHVIDILRSCKFCG